jgi:hypothetical protein
VRKEGSPRGKIGEEGKIELSAGAVRIFSSWEEERGNWPLWPFFEEALPPKSYENGKKELWGAGWRPASSSVRTLVYTGEDRSNFSRDHGKFVIKG